jgi:hypothetical protein
MMHISPQTRFLFPNVHLAYQSALIISTIRHCDTPTHTVRPKNDYIL